MRVSEKFEAKTAGHKKAAGHDILPPVNTIIVSQSTFAFALFPGATEHDFINVDVAAIGVVSGCNGDLK